MDAGQKRKVQLGDLSTADLTAGRECSFGVGFDEKGTEIAAGRDAYWPERIPC